MRIAHFVLGGVLAVVGGAAQAAVGLDFSGLQDGEQPDQFYAGGTGSRGSLGGPDRDFGVTFTNAVARCNVAFDCEQGRRLDVLVFTDAALLAPGQPEFDVNVAGGFKGDLSFVFATTQAAHAEFWSGLDGTGVLLRTIDLVEGNCPEQGPHCSFREVTLRLDEGQIAHSISFTGVNPHFFAIDNLGLDLADSPISAAPEPATWLLALAGFGLAGGALRDRRRRAMAACSA